VGAAGCPAAPGLRGRRPAWLCVVARALRDTWCARADGQRPIASRRHRHATPIVMVTAPAGPPAHLHAARSSNVPRRSPRPHALRTTGRPRRDLPRPWSHDVLRAGLADPQPRLCDNTACTDGASSCSASSATRAAFCRRGTCAQPCTPPVLVDVAAPPDRARRQEESVQTGPVRGGMRLPSPPCLLSFQSPAGTDPDRQTLQRAAALATSQSTARTAGGGLWHTRPGRGDLVGASGHASPAPLSQPRPACTLSWRPAVTGACADAGRRVTAWAEAATARPAGVPPPPLTARRGS
jgi:hypothetical protein